MPRRTIHISDAKPVIKSLQSIEISIAIVKLGMVLPPLKVISVRSTGVNLARTAHVADSADWTMLNDISGDDTATSWHKYYRLTDNDDLKSRTS